MRRIPRVIGTSTAFVALLAAGVLADDGLKTIKEMTGGSIDNKLTVSPGEVGAHLSEAEHAYTQFMPFYVPVQRASGEGDDPVTSELNEGAVDYYDIDQPTEKTEDGGNKPTADAVPVETLAVARPLINVFIYGPLHEVEGTAFAYSWMDAFAAVSLDDGETWKTTNLSESADQSSFELSADGGGGGGHSGDDDEDGHHGASLSIDLDGAYWTDQNKNFGKLQIIGDGDLKEKVTIINFDTGAVLFRLTADNKTGEFDVTKNVKVSKAPCRVAAVASGETSSPIPVQYPEGSEIACEGVDIADYPGGVSNIVHAVAGNRVMVAWPSRYCQQGTPGYSFAYRGLDENGEEITKPEQLPRRDAIEAFLGIDVTKDLYLTDLFGVSGNQGSSNFEDEGYPQVGEVPFSCLWTVRGVLRGGDDPRTGTDTEPVVEKSHMVWMKPERLTSGRRDVNRVEIDGKVGVGFSIVWQEDPEGLRPGQGEGPGEGWSGAIAHPKTDTWYSFIPWDQFAWVEGADTNDDGVGEPEDVFDYLLPNDPDIPDDADDPSGRPKPYVPMALPVRLTNNDKCQPENDPNYVDPDGETILKNPFSYCNHEVAQNYGLKNFCASTVEVEQGRDSDGNEARTGFICVSEDGLPNVANTAATRARFSLQGYADSTRPSGKSGWIVLAVEESKGLGRFGFFTDPTQSTYGQPCDPEDEALEFCEADIGKNQWYHSFDMGRVDSSAEGYVDHPNGLVANLVSQGNMLNQPEIDWRTGEMYPPRSTSEMWGAFNPDFPLFNIHDTEIARRSSLLVQPVAKADASVNGLAAFSTWKQGAMRQGGPADVMARRFVMPASYTDGLGDNPYSFANVECVYPANFVPPQGQEDPWLYKDGSNPYYPDGLCLAPATNLSAVIPDFCVDTATDTIPATPEDGLALCPQMDFADSSYGISDTNPILQGFIQGEGNTQKVLTWHQCPSDGVAQALSTDNPPLGLRDCATDGRTDVFKTTSTDQSWYNPLDVAKGHRGFIDGDFVMMMYAWSPNWRLNAKGSDRYDLYVRRSFDGGINWTTTPATGYASDGESFGGDGTVTCQIFRSAETGEGGGSDEPVACYDYAAGAAEAGRNVTQFAGQRTTTLDPRYSPTGGGIQVSIDDATDACKTALLKADNLTQIPEIDAWGCDDGSDVQDEDLRNPSRYFMVYETGDNTTAAEGEPEALDLFYGRAESFGDDYVVWAETDWDTADQCFPSDPHDEEAEPSPVIGSGFCNEFDRMTTGSGVSASESSLTATPGGGKLYGVWTQIRETDTGEEADAMARRIWWLDEWVSIEGNAWTLPGTNKEE